MRRRRPDRDKELQRLLNLAESDQAAALQAMFGEPSVMPPMPSLADQLRILAHGVRDAHEDDDDDDDDLDDLERAARLTLHGRKGVPKASRENEQLSRRLEALERETQRNGKAIRGMSRASVRLVDLCQEMLRLLCLKAPEREAKIAANRQIAKTQQQAVEPVTTPNGNETSP